MVKVWRIYPALFDRFYIPLAHCSQLPGPLRENTLGSSFIRRYTPWIYTTYGSSHKLIVRFELASHTIYHII